MHVLDATSCPSLELLENLVNHLLLVHKIQCLTLSSLLICTVSHLYHFTRFSSYVSNGSRYFFRSWTPQNSFLSNISWMVLFQRREMLHHLGFFLSIWNSTVMPFSFAALFIVVNASTIRAMLQQIWQRQDLLFVSDIFFAFTGFSLLNDVWPILWFGYFVLYLLWASSNVIVIISFCRVSFVPLSFLILTTSCLDGTSLLTSALKKNSLTDYFTDSSVASLLLFLCLFLHHSVLIFFVL